MFRINQYRKNGAGALCATAQKGDFSVIEQNLNNLPPELLLQARYFEVNHDKSPRISGWNKPENQKLPRFLTKPLGFDITNPSPSMPNYLVIDGDHVLDENGYPVNEKVTIALETFKATGTYGEISQSGRGFHFILNPTHNKFPPMSPAKLYLDDLTDLKENQRAKLEIFYKSNGRYFIFTGNKFEGSSDKILSGSLADSTVEKLVQQVEAQKAERENSRKQNPTDTATRLTLPQKASVETGNHPSEVERATEMLKFIDPSQCSYDEWLNVGMVLKNIGAPLKLWDEWSSRDEERYNKERKQTCSDKWDTFKGDGLTIATLHDMAKKEGYSEAKFQQDWRKVHDRLDSHSDTKLQPSTVKVTIVNIQFYLSNQYQKDLNLFRSVSKIKTGFENLDRVIGGIAPGLYVIGAIPSLGKTTFIHQIADNIAMSGVYVLFFSLEQTPMELVSKSIARECYKLEKTDAAPSAWSLQNISLNNVSADLAGRAFYQYKNSITDKLIIIPGIHSISLDDIINTVENFIKEHNVTPVVIIDYLQIISLDGMNSDKMRIDHITSSLKQLQSRNNLALFVISSFNRSNYMQVVDYESFKESGHIEYSADAIWGLQLQVLSDPVFKALDSSRTSGNTSRKRDMVDEAKRQQPRKIELKALKHRNHPLYSVGFSYHSAHDFFEPDPNYGKLDGEENPKEEETSSQSQTTVPPER